MTQPSHRTPSQKQPGRVSQDAGLFSLLNDPHRAKRETFLNGQVACRVGRKAGANPFNEQSRWHRYWRDGWTFEAKRRRVS